MKNLRNILFRYAALPWTLAIALLFAATTLNAQGVLSNARTGTIQQELQDEGALVISGQRYGYSDTLTTILLNGEQVNVGVLDEGLVVRYTLNPEGMLVTIELLGPNNLLPQLDDS